MNTRVDQLRERLASVMSVVKRIAGMPNYTAYVAHLREEHPGCAIPSEREYFDLYLQGKYSKGGSRCC